MQFASVDHLIDKGFSIIMKNDAFELYYSTKTFVLTISFINEQSRNMWIYLIQYMDEMFDIFKKFKALVEN